MFHSYCLSLIFRWPEWFVKPLMMSLIFYTCDKYELDRIRKSYISKLWRLETVLNRVEEKRRAVQDILSYYAINAASKENFQECTLFCLILAMINQYFHMY